MLLLADVLVRLLLLRNPKHLTINDRLDIKPLYRPFHLLKLNAVPHFIHLTLQACSSGSRYALVPSPTPRAPAPSRPNNINPATSCKQSQPIWWCIHLDHVHWLLLTHITQAIKFDTAPVYIPPASCGPSPSTPTASKISLAHISARGTTWSIVMSSVSTIPTRRGLSCETRMEILHGLSLSRWPWLVALLFMLFVLRRADSSLWTMAFMVRIGC
ncbi:hypothetical protein BJY00DRAFT_127136 [Aspergillus carlsbadensis]|nr:hypothetical protein BJY00DRAFT_127136 [Aspergillus carlsbadensis]